MSDFQDLKNRVHSYVEENPGSTTAEIAHGLDEDSRLVRSTLVSLLDTDGLLCRDRERRSWIALEHPTLTAGRLLATPWNEVSMHKLLA